MTGAKRSDVVALTYELAIQINAPRERVWKAITQEANYWWLPDFRMVGENSTVSLELKAGGGLIEQTEEGGSLLWYTVQWFQPSSFVLYLVGHFWRQ